MKLLVDMNLSPSWVPFLSAAGYEAVHWSSVGDPRAPDQTLFAWAKANGCIVFTHDLGFGTMLALTQASGPSVVQVRTQDVTPAVIGRLVLGTLGQFQSLLEAGALIVVDEARARARILPLSRS